MHSAVNWFSSKFAGLEKRSRFDVAFHYVFLCHLRLCRVDFRRTTFSGVLLLLFVLMVRCKLMGVSVSLCLAGVAYHHFRLREQLRSACFHRQGSRGNLSAGSLRRKTCTEQTLFNHISFETPHRLLVSKSKHAIDLLVRSEQIVTPPVYSHA